MVLVVAFDCILLLAEVRVYVRILDNGGHDLDHVSRPAVLSTVFSVAVVQIFVESVNHVCTSICKESILNWMNSHASTSSHQLVYSEISDVLSVL